MLEAGHVGSQQGRLGEIGQGGNVLETRQREVSNSHCRKTGPGKGQR